MSIFSGISIQRCYQNYPNWRKDFSAFDMGQRCVTVAMFTWIPFVVFWGVAFFKGPCQSATGGDAWAGGGGGGGRYGHGGGVAGDAASSCDTGALQGPKTTRFWAPTAMVLGPAGAVHCGGLYVSRGGGGDLPVRPDTNTPPPPPPPPHPPPPPLDPPNPYYLALA